MMRGVLLIAGLTVVCIIAPGTSALGQADPVTDLLPPPVTDAVTDAVTGPVAPAPLRVVRPAAGEVITERRPQLHGTGGHPAVVTVTRDGELLCTNTPVRPDGSWRCRLRSDLPHGRIRLDIVQRDQQDQQTGHIRHTFFVRPTSPTITRPRHGQELQISRPLFSGRVDLDGAKGQGKVHILERSRVLCTAKVRGRGRWSCRSRLRLAPGRHLVRAAVLGSRRSEPVAFTVRRPAPPPSPEPPPPQPSVPVTPAAPLEQPPQTPSGQAPADGDDSAADQPGRPGTGSGRRGPGGPPRSAADGARGSRPIRLALSQPAPGLAAGRMSSLTTVLGPHHGNGAIRLRVTGRLGTGLRYRAVTGPGGERCRVVGRAFFACSLTLPPGREAALRIWITPDAVHAPSVTRQRLRVVASDPSLDTAIAWRRPLGSVHSDGTSPEPPGLARETTTSPGTLLPLLALLLLALAAEAARRQPTSLP